MSRLEQQRAAKVDGTGQLAEILDCRGYELLHLREITGVHPGPTALQLPGESDERLLRPTAQKESGPLPCEDSRDFAADSTRSSDDNH